VSLTRSAFVIERRINQPLTAIGFALSNRRELMKILARDEHGGLLLDGPLRPIPRARQPSWRATGKLISARGRPAARIEVHVELCNGEAGRLQVRPLARHPERWGRRRLRCYFGLAHLAADQAGRAIRETAAGWERDRTEDRRLVHAN
jgi:hypothetical protein